MMRPVRVVAAVLLAVALSVPAAGAAPPSKVDALAAELAQAAENTLESMSCTATPAAGADYELLVVTVVCQAKHG